MQRKGISFTWPGEIVVKVDKLGTQALDLKIRTLPKKPESLVSLDHQVYINIVVATTSKEINNLSFPIHGETF